MTLGLLVAITAELPKRAVYSGSGLSDAGLADLIQGTDPRLQQILDRVPDLAEGPSPPWIFYNRHVQFIPWMIQNEIHRQQELPFQRIHIDVRDCLDKLSPDCDFSGDAYGSLSPPDQQQQQHMMNDTITIDVFPPLQSVDSPYNKDFNTSSPVIFFNPGLRCYSQDLPGTTIIRKAYEAGFRSIVVHRRGHTPGQPLRSPRWNLFGDVDDMEQVYWHVKKNLIAPNTGMFYHGISSGAAVTVSALSKWDRRRKEQPDKPAPSFVASISVTPGYDISSVMNRDRFLWPYNDVLLPGVKDTFVLKNEALLRQFDSSAVDATLAATSLQEFVHKAAPFTGYGNQSIYYRETNPINEVRDITTPKLVINARDDPCCNINNLYESSPYENHDKKTYAQMIAESQAGIVAVTKTGSHCPFLDAPRGGSFFTRDPVTGWWMINSWADRVAIEYYQATLEVYNERRFM